MIKITRDEYEVNPVFCKQCGAPLSYERKRYTFCNSSCAASFNNKGVRRVKPSGKLKKSICVECGCEFDVNRNSNGKYCSNKCQQDHQYQRNIENWKHGVVSNGIHIPSFIRKYLFDLNDSKCQECGWGRVHPITGNIPLQIYHIDGDCTNHAIDNLRLLCPNCHTMTPTYGNLNNGNSKRIHRRKQK